MPRWIKILLIFVLGLAAGLIYGLLVNPVVYVDTTPDYLRQDYRTDYVLMIAESYAASKDSQNAAHSLTLLSPQPPIFTISDALTYAETAGYSPVDLALLKNLMMAMQSYQSGSEP